MNPFSEMWKNEKGRDSLYSMFAALFVSLFNFNTNNPSLNTIGNIGLLAIALLFIGSGILSYREYRNQNN